MNEQRQIIGGGGIGGHLEGHEPSHVTAGGGDPEIMGDGHHVDVARYQGGLHAFTETDPTRLAEEHFRRQRAAGSVTSLPVVEHTVHLEGGIDE